MSLKLLDPESLRTWDNVPDFVHRPDHDVPFQWGLRAEGNFYTMDSRAWLAERWPGIEVLEVAVVHWKSWNGEGFKVCEFLIARFAERDAAFHFKLWLPEGLDANKRAYWLSETQVAEGVD